MSNESASPQLSVYLRADWLASFLRADQIRTDTLIQLVAGWSDPDTRNTIIDALDALADIAQTPHPAEGAVDAAIEDVEAAAGMDLPQIPLDKTNAIRLHAELADATIKLSRFEPGRTLRIPRQSGEEAM